MTRFALPAAGLLIILAIVLSGCAHPAPDRDLLKYTNALEVLL